MFMRLRALLALAALATLGCGGGGGGGGDSGAATGAPSLSSASGTPIATAAHAGSDQQATVSSAVAVAPAIIVTDTAGRGVSGMAVTFRVVTGGGSVIAPSVVTDSHGIARVGAWILGPAAGSNQLAAKTPGLPEVAFHAQGMPGAGMGVLAPATGTNNQAAPLGTDVPVMPSVIVRDAAGIAQAGIAVTFGVTSGSGSVANTIAVSDVNGIASAGRWTLGATAGVQTLMASAPGYTPALFSATAHLAGTPTLAREVFMIGLQTPWDMAFTPDGVMLYTERIRGLSVRLPSGSTRALFQPADLVAENQSGMLGLALDPQFATNRTAYVYMASNAGGATDNRVVAVTINSDYTSIGNRREILTGITYAGGVHSGGRVRFSPDGYLYVTTGDTRQGYVPQSLSALGAKVLRIDRDGNAAPGNNTLAGADPRIYAYGFRNVQGIDFRASTGVAYVAEHGPGYSDEVTPLRANGNGGWDPLCADGVNYCGYNGSTQMTDTVKFPGAMLPAWTTGGLSEGMAGGAFVSGAQWRDWNGAFIAALLAGRRLEVLKLDTAGTSAQSTPLLNTLGARLRTVVQGLDGALYVATDGQPGGDEIWRLVPN
jgi:glucose/arabinose dehydrogenase